MPATSDFAIAPAKLVPCLSDLLGRRVAAGDIRAELIAGGFSNLTYLVHAGTEQMILRRPPLGTLAAGSHDMGREHRILVGLATTEVPAPAPLAYVADPAALGAPFLLMERVPGLIVRSREDADALGVAGAAAVSRALADTLATIHGVDLESSTLGSLGRGDGYLQRQVDRWLGAVTALGGVPSPMRELADVLSRRAVPPTAAPRLIHGDFRIDNVVLDETCGIRAVLDWELATIGDPLADLGLLLVYWGEPGDPTVSPEYEITTAAGFWTRRQVVDRYVAQTGAQVVDLEFQVLLAHLKMAAIVQGIVQRTRSGHTPGARFEHLDAIPGALCERALLAVASGEYR